MDRMSSIERLLEPGNTELPDCRCGREMAIDQIELVPDSEAHVRNLPMLALRQRAAVDRRGKACPPTRASMNATNRRLPLTSCSTFTDDKKSGSGCEGSSVLPFPAPPRKQPAAGNHKTRQSDACDQTGNSEQARRRTVIEVLLQNRHIQKTIWLASAALIGLCRGSS